MTPKQLQKKLEVLARRFDRLSDNLRENKAEVKYLKDLVEQSIEDPVDVHADD